MVTSGYAAPPPSTVPAPLTSADITTLFKKPDGWFDRDRVRKRLYAKGFPKPFERGRWSAKAVADWMANPVPPAPPAPQAPPKRSRRPNGYAPVADAR